MRGSLVSLKYDCAECHFHYPADSDEATRDFGRFLAWSIGMAHTVAGAIVAIAGIAIACFMAIPQRQWLGAIFCLVFSAIGCGWVMLVKFGMQWLRRRSEESLQVSQQDSFKGTLDVDGQ